MSVHIRPAVADDADVLTELAMRSKAHWGYSEEFMASCCDELTVSAEHLDNAEFDCFVAIRSKEVLGFYSVLAKSDSDYELEALFVEPAHIGLGVGRQLVEHAIEFLRKRGVEKLTIQGDPHATEFYQSVGGREAGQRESESIPGRFLPLFVIDIK